MARNVSVVITDDLDGSEGAQPVTFGIDGVNYEIDLAEPNHARLTGALAPFVEAGRRVTPRGNSRRSPGPRPDRAAIRAWARQAGLEVPERGRISGKILEQYEAAH